MSWGRLIVEDILVGLCVEVGGGCGCGEARGVDRIGWDG